MKRCPYCAEDVQPTAVVCKHCGRDIKPDASVASLLLRLGWSVGAAFALIMVFGALAESVAHRGVPPPVGLPSKPITLTDEVQNVPANSWTAVPLSLPYAGTLDVRLQVVNGNPLDVFLTTEDHVNEIKRGDWRQLRAYPAFDAVRTRTVRRDAKMEPGTYYLVMRDPTLGILSARASDVSVIVTLRPS